MSDKVHDQWHRHTDEEGRPMHEHGAHTSAKALGFTFIAMTLGVLLVIIVLKVYFDSYISSYKAKIDENTSGAKAAWIHKQDVLGRMAPYIPRASEAVVAEYASAAN